MTDKELKKLKRSELLEIILVLQDKQDELQAENDRLRHELEYRHEMLLSDEAFGGPAAKLSSAIKELKQAADAYLLRMEEESEKIVSKRDKIQ